MALLRSLKLTLFILVSCCYTSCHGKLQGGPHKKTGSKRPSVAKAALVSLLASQAGGDVGNHGAVVAQQGQGFAPMGGAMLEARRDLGPLLQQMRERAARASESDEEKQLRQEIQTEIAAVKALQPHLVKLEADTANLENYKVELAALLAALPPADKEKIANLLKEHKVKDAFDELVRAAQQDTVGRMRGAHQLVRATPSIEKMYPRINELIAALKTTDEDWNLLDSAGVEAATQLVEAKKALGNYLAHDHSEGSLYQLLDKLQTSKALLKADAAMTALNVWQIRYFFKRFLNASYHRNWTAAEIEAKTIAEKLQSLEGMFKSDQQDVEEAVARGQAVVKKIKDLLTPEEGPQVERVLQGEAASLASHSEPQERVPDFVF